MIGANTTEAHPVTGYRIKEAVRNGTRLIVADPRKIELVKYSDLWLRHQPGTDIALLNGMAHIILRDDLMDHQFVSERTDGFEEFYETVKAYTPEKVADITGLTEEKIEQAAYLYGKAKKATTIYAMGITQHATGTNNVMALANLAILTGNVGRRGTGVDPLRGQNNVQGACDMGCLPNYYPSYQSVEDSDVRRKFEEFWKIKLPEEPGLTVTEMTESAHQGKLKTMYIMGENPVLSDPNVNHVIEGLQRLEFLVVQDIFLTETANLADVVLPATTFAEKNGTFTNTERRVQLARKAIERTGQAKPDCKIIVELAQRMGHSWHYPEGPAQIMEEIAGCSPLYGGISHQRLERGGLQWPCPTSSHPGTPYLHADGFSRGKGKFHGVEYLEPEENPDQDYPLVLTTGRMLYHFHTGTMSRRSRLEDLRSEELAMMHPKDAKMYDIKDDDLIYVESRRGKITTRVQVTDLVPAGVIFMTFHFRESPANMLTIASTDPISKIPELKVCAVKVQKAGVKYDKELKDDQRISVMEVKS